MKAKNVLIQLIWSWMWLLTIAVGVSDVSSAQGGGYLAIAALVFGGLQAGVQTTLLLVDYWGE